MNDDASREPLDYAAVQQLLVAVEVIEGITGHGRLEILQALRGRRILTGADLDLALIVLDAMEPE